MMRGKAIALADLPAEWRALLAVATEARRNAYAPYSCFPVGAAVRTASGRVFAGSNVENASTGLTVCAERLAIWKAVSEGEHHLKALVVVTEPGSTPCGACRQVMSEFAADLPILVADTNGHVSLTSLGDLYPDPFPKAKLQEMPSSRRDGTGGVIP